MCAAKIQGRIRLLWVIRDRGGRSHTTVHIRFTPIASDARPFTERQPDCTSSPGTSSA
jgi:hypothetical protein